MLKCVQEFEGCITFETRFPQPSHGQSNDSRILGAKSKDWNSSNPSIRPKLLELAADARVEDEKRLSQIMMRKKFKKEISIKKENCYM